MYDELLKLWNKESDGDSLILLPKNFKVNVHSYIEKLQAFIKTQEEGSIERDLLKNEIQEFSRLLNEFLKVRLNKLICLTIDGVDLEKSHLMLEEKQLIESFKSILTKFYGSFKFESEQEQAETPIVESSSNLVVIRLLQDMEQIVGIDLKNYGPFKKEDIATIPEKNAISLIEKNAAMLIKTN